MFEPCRPERNSWTPSCLRGGVGNLDDDRLDQHLLAADVELADHLAQGALDVGRGRDDDRIGALEAGDDRVPRGRAAALPAGAAAAAGARAWSAARPRRRSPVALAASPGARSASRGWVGGLAEQLLEHRQQLRGVGMLEEDDPDLAAARGAPVELLRRCRPAGRRWRRRRGRRSRWSCRPATTETPVGRELGERRGDLARAGIVEADDPGRARVDVDPRQHLPDPGDIVGEVGDDDRAPRSAVIAPSRLTSGRSVSTAAAASMWRTRKISVTKPLGLAATGADRRGRGRAGDRLDPERAARDRHRDEAVGAHRRQEQFEIFAARQRPLGHHRDPALDGGIDDEGAPGHPRRILDEGADVGVAQVEDMLRRWRRKRRAEQREGKQYPFH